MQRTIYHCEMSIWDPREDGGARKQIDSQTEEALRGLGSSD